jgi:aspartyl protease family protein
VAEQAGAEPDEDARPLTLVTADGRRIEAQQVIVPRMRIGKFEAENVKAALLDRSVQIGRPLLGMSFLERFRFEIDAAKQELRLLRVDTGDE